jgi:hypothetical protein
VASELVYHERDWKNSSYAIYEEENIEIPSVKVHPLWLFEIEKQLVTLYKSAPGSAIIDVARVDYDKSKGKVNTASDSKKAITATAKNSDFRQDILDSVEDRIKKSLTEFAEKYGQKGEITITFSGFIDAHYEFRLNSKNGLQLSIYDSKGRNKGTYENSTGVTFGCDYGIEVGVKLQLSSEITMKWSKLNAYVPKFLGEGNFTDIKAEFEIEGEIGGSIHYETTYIRNGSGSLKKQQIIICTGIRGIAYVNAKISEVDIKNRKNGRWEYKKGKKPIKDDTPLLEKPKGEYTELLEGFKIPFDPEPVFDDSLKKYF